MSVSVKLSAGSNFPSVRVNTLDGTTITLGRAYHGALWQMVVIYRGQHCPLCTKFLNRLEEYKTRLQKIGLDIVAASADSISQLKEHKERLTTSYPIGYGLSQKQMQQLGLYISIPRSEQETDHDFAEPGLFVVNRLGEIIVIDISNNPFSRPELESLVSGLEWISDPDNDYPIRGTLAY
ncbi:redoxin domain-containing protein [Shewanella atlantica]|uniref:redoxin domain-containing protein n=1 Tax=Shewanella atlantica TaxID=271099 RepID=UPI003734E781